MQDVNADLQALHIAHISLKLGKCEWRKSAVEYQRDIITLGHLEICRGKVQASKELEHQQTQFDHLVILGRSNAYHQFFKAYARVTNPLNTFLGKRYHEKLETLNNEQTYLFETLIDAAIGLQILAFLSKGFTFSIGTDLSNYQVGTGLFQIYPGEKQKQLSFWSFHLNPHE